MNVRAFFMGEVFRIQFSYPELTLNYERNESTSLSLDIRIDPRLGVKWYF